MYIDARQHDKFVLKQRWSLVINRYEIYLPEDETTMFLFAEQARFKWKEEIHFYSDDSKMNLMFSLKAREAFDPWATYDVFNAYGQPLGEIRKEFGMSLLRSRYTMYDLNGHGPLMAQEMSVTMGLIRRFIGIPASFIPFVGEIINNLVDWLPFPYHFEFKRGEQLIGVNRRRIGKFSDIYDLDFSSDAERTADRWMLLTLCVCLDALQAR